MHLLHNTILCIGISIPTGKRSITMVFFFLLPSGNRHGPFLFLVLRVRKVGLWAREVRWRGGGGEDFGASTLYLPSPTLRSTN